MREYIIRQIDDEEFLIPFKQWKDVLRPSSFVSNVVEESGWFCIDVEGCKITFSPEPLGLQVSFEDCNISTEVADQIVSEILASMEAFTNQKGKIIPLQ